MPYIFYGCCDVIDKQDLPEYGALKAECWTCGSLDHSKWLQDLDEWDPARRFTYNARINWRYTTDQPTPWRP